METVEQTKIHPRNKWHGEYKTAWTTGYIARHNAEGGPMSKREPCPHKLGSVLQVCWAQGWNVACEDIHPSWKIKCT